MKAFLHLLVGGQSLRHRPVGLRPGEQAPVRAIAQSAAGERDVTGLLFPVSLSPLLLGLCRSADEPPAGPLEVRMRDAATDCLLGSIALAPAGRVDHRGGRIDLLRPTKSSVRCVPLLYKMLRYALAWRQVRWNARRPHAFRMSLADLKALNVFYIMPRPVHLVSVQHEDSSNIFPMDLVGPLGANRFLLALRLTSPSVATMRESGRIVVSGAPARLKDAVYRLGAHHKEKRIDWSALPFEVTPSEEFGIPVPAEALRVRELEVERCEPIGSHMFFVTQVARDTPRSDEPQLCHVSDMVARWRAERGMPFADA